MTTWKRSQLGANIQLSSEISRFFAADMISPADLIALLTDSGVEFVLAGAYATSVWTGRPRATMDVDVVVAPAHHRRAVQAVQDAYPNLQVQETTVVTRFLDPAIGHVVLNLMKPAAPITLAIFEASTEATVGGCTVRIPDLEMSAALKFAVMIGPWRDLSKKYIDAGDFIAIIRAHPELDVARLARFGELIYPGGGGEITKVAQDPREGRRLVF